MLYDFLQFWIHDILHIDTKLLIGLWSRQNTLTFASLLSVTSSHFFISLLTRLPPPRPMTELIIPIEIMRNTDWTVPRARRPLAYVRYSSAMSSNIASLCILLGHEVCSSTNHHFHPFKTSSTPMRYHWTFYLQRLRCQRPMHEFFTHPM